MKTKIFNIWTNSIEKILNEVSNDKEIYDQLNEWMDSQGAKYFQIAQTEYHKENQERYLQMQGNFPRLDLAIEQILCGFNKVFSELFIQFPTIKNNMEKLTEKFLNECRGEKYLPFIACRAVLTYQMVVKNNPDKLQAAIETRDAFALLAEAAKNSVESLDEHLAKVQQTISRNTSSPFMFQKETEKPPLTSVEDSLKNKECRSKV